MIAPVSVLFILNYVYLLDLSYLLYINWIISMSCLYRALAHFIPGAKTEQLRGMLCEYLSNDPELGGGKASEMVPWETGISLQNYVQQMKNMGQWGGAIEIKAFCDLFGLNVKVHSFPNRRTIEFISQTSKGKVPWVEITWTGNHYEPVIKERRKVITPSPQHQGGRRHRNLPHVMSQTQYQTKRAKKHRHSARFHSTQRPQGHSHRTRSRHRRRRTSSQPSGFSSTQQLPQINNPNHWNQTQQLTNFSQNGGMGPWDQTISPQLRGQPRGYNNYSSSTQGFSGFGNSQLGHTTYYPF